MMPDLDRCEIGDCREIVRLAKAIRASETQLAYCAGVIDSDGTIGVKRSTYGMRVVKGCAAPNYSERISVKQVERQAVDLLNLLFGGARYVQNPSAGKGKPLESWDINNRKAAVCIYALLPYLRIKREQALNCLRLRVVKERSKRERVAFGRGHAGSAHRTERSSQEMEQAYARAKELNRVGV